MRVLIEFYRVREADDAHAVIGREIAEAADLDGAVEIAHRLLRTLDFPQQPDGLSIRACDPVARTEGHTGAD